jgi:hypothetical protein
MSVCISLRFMFCHSQELNLCLSDWELGTLTKELASRILFFFILAGSLSTELPPVPSY